MTVLVPDPAMDYTPLFQRMDAPFSSFGNAQLGPEFPQELATVSRLWFRCGYRPGIAAYLNFFLLSDFIVTHDANFPPRFKLFKSMADSFYQTDLFIRDVTDSGKEPTGGISNPKVRAGLAQIMRRHQKVSIPPWMMTYFGFSLLETVEKQSEPLTDEERRLHLQYMAKTYRIMGIPFSDDRALMQRFARSVESAHAGQSPDLEKHSRHILALGEMVGVDSRYPSISTFLPERTRAVFQQIYPRVRPSLPRRLGARLLGRLLMKQAIGAPRVAVPFDR